MKNMKLKAVLLAIASAALISNSAHAVTTVNNAGDILLGVEDTSGTVTQDFEIDLGSISKFDDVAVGTTINVVNLQSDLTTVFGASPLSNSNLQYGVIGTSSNVGGAGFSPYAIFISNAEDINGIPEVPTLEGSQSAQSVATGQITGFENGPAFSAFSGQPANGTVSPDATSVTASGSNSFASREATDGFGTGDNDLNILSGISDLDINPTAPRGGVTPGTDVGQFAFTSSGELTFTGDVVTSVVPEPSTYALAGIGSLLLLWQLRRRASSNL